jgi:hypothetical protein
MRDGWQAPSLFFEPTEKEQIKNETDRFERFGLSGSNLWRVGCHSAMDDRAR